MISKSWISATGLSVVLWALTSCAQDGPALEQGVQARAENDAFACGEQGEISEEELAAFIEQMEQIGPERLEVMFEEWKPVAEALSEYFSEMTERTARPGTSHEAREQRHGTFTAFETNASTAPEFFRAIEETGHDMARERVCSQLVPTKLQVEPDCRPVWYFFCWRDPGLDLLSAYRQDAGGWVKVDTP